MQADAAAPATSKKMLWSGRVVSALPVLMLTFSAVAKLTHVAGVDEEFARLGYPESLVVPIGIVELTCTVLYAIPQTAVLGAILLTGYLGGATATHLRIGDPFVPPVIAGIVVWVGLYLRDARLRAIAFWRR
jgi:DoxX-like family